MELNDYCVKIIPDLAYIDYMEKVFYTSKTKQKDNIWYYAHINEGKGAHKIQSYRCLIVSPVELTFNNCGESICKLNNYHDNFIYVYFKDDEIYNANDCTFTNNDTADYIFELRF